MFVCGEVHGGLILVGSEIMWFTNWKGMFCVFKPFSILGL